MEKLELEDGNKKVGLKDNFFFLLLVLIVTVINFDQKNKTKQNKTESSVSVKYSFNSADISLQQVSFLREA